ncbi:MAG: DNA translocase FtsK 4TM domain-containing protein [Flavobacteriales bacterium]|nr:DNA translocase FtsK 4TM domain-containing protein [Flavobacteriales bacterium]
MVKNKKNKYPQLSINFENKTAQVVFGLLFLCLSILLFLSFTSFFLSWKKDFDLSQLNFIDLITNSEIIANNLLGKVGAYFGDFFIYQQFGIASFLMPFFLFITGLQIFTNQYIIKLKRLFLNSLFISLWLTTFFGLYFTQNPILGGYNGIQISNWLNSLIGLTGVSVILAFSMLIFIGIYFHWTPEKIQEFFKRKVNNINLNELPKVNISEEDIIEEKIQETLDLNTKNKIDNSEETLNDLLEKELSIEQPTNEENSESTSEKVQMDVEIKDEETLTDKEVNKALEEFGEYDPKLDLGHYKHPTIDLMIEYPNSEVTVNKEELEANKNQIVETLNNYKIEISKIKATVGPTVTLYEIVPAPGVRISKIKGLENDIALSLAALGIRIIAPLPGKGTIGIEVPNSKPSIVSMKSVLASEKFQHANYELPIGLGKTISNETFVADLAKMPHLLMAGATGQGKSVGLNAILASLLYKKHPAQLKFVLVDPKKVELTLFNKIERHFLAKLPDSEEAIITDTKKVVNTVNSLCIEMDARYDLLKKAQVRNIKEYNHKFINRKLNPENGHRYLPYIVLVIDEFADLIMTAGKEIETPIARLAQLARAIGIHLIVATQRPTTNIITGTIKANFPARIAFRVTSVIDSRTIMDAAGANQLIGRGDMLISDGNEMTRLQCAFIDTPEVEKLTEFIGNQQGYPMAFELPEYVGEEAKSIGTIDLNDRDSLFRDAASVIVMHQQGSASLLQRKLKLGYNRAGRIIDQLEAAGIIGPFEGSKARQVLIPDEYALEQLLNNESQE